MGPVAGVFAYLMSAGAMVLTTKPDRDRAPAQATKNGQVTKSGKASKSRRATKSGRTTIAGVARDLRQLPAAAAVGMFGSMSLVIPQTAMQRVIPNAVLGRVSAVFLTGEAAATLLGAAAGPFLAQAAGLDGVAATASLVTLGAAALTGLRLPGPLRRVSRSVDRLSRRTDPDAHEIGRCARRAAGSRFGDGGRR